MATSTKTVKRCGWVGSDPLYIAYHDKEWGVAVHDDAVLFEFLILESAQAGLSWLTVLKRREGYRRVFHNFNAAAVAAMTDADIQTALCDEGIIRNKLKVQATVRNAAVFCAIVSEFGSFNTYIWSFVDYSTVRTSPRQLAQLPTTSPQSDRLSADLKKRGMTFVGSTIVYALMQACGLVNDHEVDCFRYNEV